MKDLKLGSKDSDLKLLCELLEVPVRSEFDKYLDTVVRSYQSTHNLVRDGWVGYNTWKSLILNFRAKHHNSNDITDWDYEVLCNLDETMDGESIYLNRPYTGQKKKN